jgi:pilus assembly protein CpaB
MSRRARAVALLGLSGICAGVAVSLVDGYASDVRARVGPVVPVVVAARDLPRGRLITPRVEHERLAVRQVPARFVPPDSFRSTSDALGLRALTPVREGSYVGVAQLVTPGNERTSGLTGRPARVVEVPVSGATTTADLLRPGSRVDVLITSDRGSGQPRTYLSLQHVELVGLRSLQSEAVGRGDSGPDAVAALRVSLRQAVLLTAAQNFARELRLVPRPQGDNRRFPPTAVAAGDLHP